MSWPDVRVNQLIFTVSHLVRAHWQNGWWFWSERVLTPLCPACRAGLEQQESHHCRRWWSPSPSVWPWSIWCCLLVGGSVWCLKWNHTQHCMYMSEAPTDHFFFFKPHFHRPLQRGPFTAILTANAVWFLLQGDLIWVLNLHLGHTSLRYVLAHDWISAVAADGFVLTYVLTCCLNVLQTGNNDFCAK